jgi:hypothetical protein
MGWRCVLQVDQVGRAELEQLSGSVVRGEADRARAVLWSLAGESRANLRVRGTELGEETSSPWLARPHEGRADRQHRLRRAAGLARPGLWPATGRTSRPWCWSSTTAPSTPTRLSPKRSPRGPWLTVEWLPQYAPELSDVERSWRDLKQHYLARRTFCDADELDAAVHDVVSPCSRERRAAARVYFQSCLEASQGGRPGWYTRSSTPVRQQRRGA